MKAEGTVCYADRPITTCPDAVQREKRLQCSKFDSFASGTLGVLG